ncbi:MAG TPA: NUDIX domain-containing protein, partial [Chitinophagaceae bacterium]|nr:NUDIX domain-containing protein [Chitinophagaceae bacterium]
GWDYYLRFIKTYPSVQQLAAAKENEVMKLWEGLGYYSRCRNLLATAKKIVGEGGNFPRDYHALLTLKGVGPYTAAAIASFAYNLPYAVVDGNVFRVLSRYFGLSEPVDSTKGKHLFTDLAARALDHTAPGEYNQAIMDFGATVCTPFAPACNSCPLQKNCTAFQQGLVNRLPVKEKMLVRKHRWFTYFVLEHRGKQLIFQRTAQDIWRDLHEFYLVETQEQVAWNEEKVQSFLFEQFGIRDTGSPIVSGPYTQLLTHQEIRARFIYLKLNTLPQTLKGGRWLNSAMIKKLAFPRIINTYLQTAGVAKES